MCVKKFFFLPNLGAIHDPELARMFHVVAERLRALKGGFIPLIRPILSSIIYYHHTSIVQALVLEIAQ